MKDGGAQNSIAELLLFRGDHRHVQAEIPLIALCRFSRPPLCALVWESYDAIVDACIAAWNWLIANPERITSIGTRDWACVNL